MVFLITLSLVSINLVYADKIYTTPGQGLQVNSWTIEAVKQNHNFTFVWDVSDSNGMLLKANTTNCTFVNFPNGILGSLVSGKGTMTPDNNGWYFTVSGNNLSNTGVYNFQIDCYLVSNSTISGNLLSSYRVTPLGTLLTTGYSMMIIFAFCFIVVIAILFFIMGLKIDMIGVKLFFLSMSAILIVILTGYGIIIGNNLLWEYPSFISGFNALYILLIGLLGAGAIGLLLYFIASIFTTFQKTKYGIGE